MKKLPALISGLAIGATLMYIFDPEKGNQRRTLIRDKAVGLKNDAQESITGTAQDLSNRAKGLLHETKSAFTNGKDQDEQNKEDKKTQSQTA